MLTPDKLIPGAKILDLVDNKEYICLDNIPEMEGTLTVLVTPVPVSLPFPQVSTFKLKDVLAEFEVVE